MLLAVLECSHKSNQLTGAESVHGQFGMVLKGINANMHISLYDSGVNVVLRRTYWVSIEGLSWHYFLLEPTILSFLVIDFFDVCVCVFVCVCVYVCV